MLAAVSGSLGNAIDSAAVFGMMWRNDCTGSAADTVRCVRGISWSLLLAFAMCFQLVCVSVDLMSMTVLMICA